MSVVLPCFSDDLAHINAWDAPVNIISGHSFRYFGHFAKIQEPLCSGDS